MADRNPMCLVRRGAGVAVVVLLAVIAPPAAGAPPSAATQAAPATKPARPSPAQHRELNRLLGRFIRPGAPGRAEIAGKILQIRPAGAKRLLGVVDVDITRLMIRYRDAFTATAARIRAERSAGAASGPVRPRPVITAQVRQARAAVLSMVKAPSLSAFVIRTQGDPAMAKLAGLLMVQPQTVLDSSEDLARRRKELLALGDIRQRCLAAGATAQGRTKDPAAKKPTMEEYLTRAEKLAVLLAIPMYAASRRTLLANAKLEGKLKAEEARGIRELNRMRLLLGLQALKIDLRLCRAARDHSHDMTTRGFFGHISPVPGKRLPWDRAKRFGTTASAENLTFGVRTGKGAIWMWFHSPEHFKTTFGPHRRVGLGYDGKWTQMFGR